MSTPESRIRWALISPRDENITVNAKDAISVINKLVFMRFKIAHQDLCLRSVDAATNLAQARRAANKGLNPPKP